jgi:RNA polymerase sigma factor (sigma-70 family)
MQVRSDMLSEMSDTDLELLARYTRQHAEDAFAELVRRHLGLVYSAALRQVRSPQLAEEVSQSVFIDLARSAVRLKPDTILTAWLYQVARRTSIDVVRREASRQLREQIATEMNAMNATADDWTHIEPLLDEAMHALDDTDRAAVLLRYFENKPLREVGATLGTSENAAQKRLGRAVERLRQFLAKRGVTVGASGLAILISANAVQAAPVGLAVTISAAALVAGTTFTTTAIATAAATKAIVMTTLQKTIIGVTLAVAIGTGIYEARQISGLRGEIQTLQQQQATLVEENGQLLRERDEAANRLITLAADIGGTKGNTPEMLKLRGELARLSAELRESPMTRIALLKRKLEQMPDKRIPELQLLTEKDWAMAAWDADLDTEDGVRKALSVLRERAIDRFLSEMMRPAIEKSLAANAGLLPADLFQLKPYFATPVTDEMLQRYKLLQTGKPNPDEDLVRLVAHVDEEYDSHHTMSLDRVMAAKFNRAADAVKIAAVEFANDNNGQLPSDPSQLSAYLKQPIDAATVQKYLREDAANPPPPEAATLAPALKAFTEANGGKAPEDPFDVVPYLSTPEQQAAFLRLMEMPPEAAALMPALKAYAGSHKGQALKNPADLRPYLTTPEQEAALQKLEQWRRPHFK